MTGTMKAAVFVGPGELELQEVPIPEVGPGDVLLRVGANTVCGTDGRILRGEKSAGVAKGVVLGHELAGYVIEVGSEVTGFKVGDLVGVLPTLPCGVCLYCMEGEENLCEDSSIFGYDVNGGLAEYVLIPKAAILAGCAFVADPKLAPEQVSMAEPLGCVLNGADNYQVHVGDTVLIIGAGPIGLLHLQVARLSGASQVIVSDPSDARRDYATQFGATHVIDPTKEDLQAFVRSLTDGRGADVAVICIGVAPLVSQAMVCVKKRGRVSLFAGFPKGVDASIDPNIVHYNEIFISGASNASRESHKLALRLISEGKIDVGSLVTHKYALGDVFEAINFATSGDGIKIAVVPE